MKTSLLLVAIAATLPLAPALAADRFNRGVESVHQPVVRRSDLVMDVPAATIGAADRARVLQWFDAVELGYGDRVSIDDSAAGSAAGAADVEALVARYGLLTSAGAPVTEGAIPPGYLRIVISRSTASVPGCPDYHLPSQPNFASSASTNYGCAVNSTMAAMIANPQDFVRGAEARGVDAQVTTKAIRLWRNTAPSSSGGLKTESAKGN